MLGWGCGSAVEQLPIMLKALGSNLSLEGEERWKERKKSTEEERIGCVDVRRNPGTIRNRKQDSASPRQPRLYREQEFTASRT